MSTIHLHETTSATPGQFVAGLTDFGPGRSKLFGNSADQYLKVHSQGPDYADVTEGSGGILGTPALRGLVERIVVGRGSESAAEVAGRLLGGF